MKQKRDFNWPFFLGLTVIMIVVLSLPKCAFAGEATLSWTHPTQYEGGVALPIGQIARTEVEYGVCNAGKTGFAASPAPLAGAIAAPAATTTITGLGVGTWCFHARTVTVAGGVSVWTGFASKTIVAPPPPVPQPPTNLTVAPGSLTAYSVVKRVDRFALIPVGVAAEGTPCISDQQVNGYYVIPRASVVWSGTVRPDVVVALCS